MPKLYAVFMVENPAKKWNKKYLSSIKLVNNKLVTGWENSIWGAVCYPYKQAARIKRKLNKIFANETTRFGLEGTINEQ